MGGPLGLAGLLALLGSAFGKLGAAARRREGAETTPDTNGPLVAAMTGALVASAAHALTIEVLHFRHFWMLMAIVCAIEARVAGGMAQTGRPAQSSSPWSRQREAAA
jgi:hypothetical protein